MTCIILTLGFKRFYRLWTLFCRVSRKISKHLYDYFQLRAHALSASVKDDSRPNVVEDTETEALGEVGPEAGKPNTGLLRLKDLRDGVTMK